MSELLNLKSRPPLQAAMRWHETTIPSTERNGDGDVIASGEMIDGMHSNTSLTSTSSDIQVAAPVGIPSSFSAMASSQAQRLARVDNGRMLIVNVRSAQDRSCLKAAHQHVEPQAGLHQTVTPSQPVYPTDENGRNDRGTFSRAYAQQHPEIVWVHRGQGRYLPASEVKREPEVRRHSRWAMNHSISNTTTVRDVVLNSRVSTCSRGIGRAYSIRC